MWHEEIKMNDQFDIKSASKEQKLKMMKDVAESSPFYKTLGIKVVELNNGTAKLEIENIDPLRQPAGLIHGGALASLADSAMAMAILSYDLEPRGFATIEMKINYILPVSDGKVIAEAKIVRRGKRVIFGTCDLFNDKNRLVAQAMLTFIYLEPDGTC